MTQGCVGVALWAGDSRLYRVRDGSILQITRDHNPVVDLLDTGNISEQEALAVRQSQETNRVRTDE